MSATLTSLYLRRAGRVLPPPVGDGRVLGDPMIATASANLRCYGFAFSPELIAALRVADADGFAAWWADVEQAVRDVVGAVDGGFPAPFYPDFPREVMAASDAKLYLNAVLHYFGDTTGTRIMPRRRGRARREIFDFPGLKTLALGDQGHLDEILAQVLGSRLAWGPTEVADVGLALAARRHLVLGVVADGLANRENRAHLWALAEKAGDREAAEAVARLFDGATDALRAAAAYGGFSPALPPITRTHVPVYEAPTSRWWGQPRAVHRVDIVESDRIRFGSIPGRVRRTLLALVDADPHAEAALARRPGLWKTLGERIHPGDHAARYPHAYRAFTALRNGSARGRNSEVERAYAARDVLGVVAALDDRPGELVRRLDALLRLDPTPAELAVILRALDSRAHEVSTHVLWQAWAHFVGRDAVTVRAVMPKGSVAKLQTLPPFGAPLPAETRTAVTTRLRAAVDRAYAARPPLVGTYRVDPALDGLRIPNALRNATTGYDAVGRGSRVRLPLVGGSPATTVRLFTHWRDLPPAAYGDADRSRVDIDLSAVLYDEDLERRGAVFYGNLRGQGVTHSGDITSAPEGAAEFIDVDVATLRGQGIRYVAISVIAYTGQSLSTIPELFAGVQVRAGDAQAGEVFDARTVATKFAITSDGRSTVPLLLDLRSLEMVWVDATIRPRERHPSLNVLGTTITERQLVEGILGMTGPSVGDVVRANVMARGGVLVDWPEGETGAGPGLATGARPGPATGAGDVDHTVTHGVDGLTIPMTELLADWL